MRRGYKNPLLFFLSLESFIYYKIEVNIMYLLLTVGADLHSFYEGLTLETITYLGYTDDVSIAKIYAKQFKLIRGVVYYLPTTPEFIKGIANLLEDNLSEIHLFNSNDNKKSIALTDCETEYLEEVYSECSDIYDDLKYAVDSLVMFDDKRIKKLRRELKKVYKILNDADTEDEEEKRSELIDSIDYGLHYIFLAKRLNLFQYNYKHYTK